jgi:NADH-quinone oxidoreductase subunit L
MVNFLDLIWLIPLVPLAGAALMLFFGRLLPKSVVSLLCPGAVLISFLISAGAVLQLTGTTEKTHEVVQFLWLPAVGAQWGFFLDPLSSVMILVVTGIGFLIHVYSIGYMGHEGGYYRFFGYLNLFVFFMLMLVLANNYLLLFVGWEGVGLCSYLLIGFYFDRKSAGDAGKKAFIVNRIGDAGFLIGMLLLWQLTGSMRFTSVNHALEHGGFNAETAAWGVLSTTALLLFVGATGKSAQFPLYVWLPDAMEGPTPVSALIHAATMVTAGVYVVCRSHVLFELAPMTSNIVAVIGAFTAIFAATIGIAQNDIKRVLAYSTVSQLGYMFLAAGVGAYWVAIFHLFTHAFFKALLFLGAGSVIHGCGGEQDMRKMGGLKKYMPVTHAVMFIATLAISGIPGFAGFFSKDEILAQVWGSVHGSRVLYVVGLTTAAMTAFYMWRLMYMTFYRECRSHIHAHESPKVMTVPLMVLALGSIVAGWFAVPRWWTIFPDSFRFFETWLANVFGREAGPHTIPDVPLTLASVGAALLGIFVARRCHLLTWDNPIYRAMQNKWYVDEIYDVLFVNGFAKGGGQLLADFDRTVVDGGVNGTGWLTRVGSSLSIWWDTWIVDGAVRLGSFLVKLAGYPVRLLQTGFVQEYALVFVAGVLAMIGYYFVR